MAREVPNSANDQEWLAVAETILTRHSQALLQKGLPPILEIRGFAGFVGLNFNDLSKMIFGASRFYHSFEIPKRKGGTRRILSPLPSLKYVQTWIYRNILAKGYIHEAVHGFCVGRSVVTNASFHVQNSALLKCDISDFFPTITIQRVYGLFKSFGYSKSVSFFLAKLTTCNGVLPQGAPTSPAISNLIAYAIDCRIEKLCKKGCLIYTRYADDITISGNRITVGLAKTLRSIIEDEGFKLNLEKTRIIRSRGKRIVTGISIATGCLRPTKKFRRETRQEVHLLVSKGIIEGSTFNGVFDPIHLDRVLGRLGFWLQVETDNAFALKSKLLLKELAAAI